MSSDVQNLENIRVLVVEDNPVYVRLIRVILDHMGYQYEIAEDGRIAVDHYKMRTYHIILMDCQMPVMDGLQATRHIREHELTSVQPRCPIIALTANTIFGFQEQCLAAGMDDFLSKPFRNRDLIEKILNWAGERKSI